MMTGIYFGFSNSTEIRKRFNMIRNSGFDSISFWWGTEYNDPGTDYILLPGMAAEAGLVVENVHAPFINSNFIWTDGAEATELLNSYVDIINSCSRHNIPTVVLHLTRGDIPPQYNQTGIDNLKKIIVVAEEKNINIALENIRRLDYLDFVFKNIKSEKLKLCYDSGHENCYSKETNIIKEYGDRLITVHLHDNDGINDQHYLPGFGNINWDRVSGDLKKVNFEGPISLEVINDFTNKEIILSDETFLELAHEKAMKLVKKCITES